MNSEDIPAKNLRDYNALLKLVCVICSETACSRGGVPLLSPGCCEALYHMECIIDLVKTGDKQCPMCRAEFNNSVKKSPKSSTSSIISKRFQLLSLNIRLLQILCPQRQMTLQVQVQTLCWLVRLQNHQIWLQISYKNL